MSVILELAKWIVVGYVVLYAVLGLLIIVTRRGSGGPELQTPGPLTPGEQLVAEVEEYLAGVR